MKIEDGEIGPGDYLAVTILGPARVKVDPEAEIRPGNPLTVDNAAFARIILTQDINGMLIAEKTGIIGKALEASNGSGTITVFLSCR